MGENPWVTPAPTFCLESGHFMQCTKFCQMDRIWSSLWCLDDVWASLKTEDMWIHTSFHNFRPLFVHCYRLLGKKTLKSGVIHQFSNVLPYLVHCTLEDLIIRFGCEETAWGVVLGVTWPWQRSLAMGKLRIFLKSLIKHWNYCRYELKHYIQKLINKNKTNSR